MCGIVAYLGPRKAKPILLESLKRLEYRGYDSAGIAIIENGKVKINKCKGKIAELNLLVENEDFAGTVGLAHTRWATHGEPSTINAHPHCDCSGEIALVHNGIIENYFVLRKTLKEAGHSFSSDTDTEVLVHLIEHYYNGNLEDSVREALSQVEGTYGLAVISLREPDKIVVARNGSPLVIGLGKDETFIASDVSAMLRYTRQVIYLEDKEIAVVTRDGFTTTTINNESVNKIIQKVDWDLAMIEKGGFPHFMLKEIHEQPETIKNTMRGRLIQKDFTGKLDGLNMNEKELYNLKRVLIFACGTSFHAGLVGEYMIEDLTGIPVEVEYASEFRYRNAPLDPDGTVVIAISQSGETADTLAAMREAKRRGCKVLGIVNVVGSTIAREADGGIYIHAGPEIGVASTKAFTCQLIAFALFTLLLGRRKSLSSIMGAKIIKCMQKLPEQMQGILDRENEIEKIASLYFNQSNFLYLGRGYNYPIALEGALKLKEISYIHAEGYPAAEMKHGPIALIDKNMPVVVIATADMVYEKVISNIEEVKARKGKIITIASEGDEKISRLADHVFYIPQTLDFLYPILTVVPLQLLAYQIAVKRDCNVDQPRNLAKSVTVE